jgi:hypothetical protein
VKPSRSDPLAHVPSALRPALRRALEILLEGFNAAAERRANPWEFAVGIAELRAARVTVKALRVLVQEGYIQYAIETTERSGKQRKYRRDDTLPFRDKSCFVLTDTGVVAARKLSRHVPFYDREERELWARGQMVKRLRQRAPDQEAILSSFQELGWPRHMDDPLLKHSGQDSKDRLGDTIFRLNHHQQHGSIRFERDGTGEGIIWRFTDA